jgi:hypothetical protein
MMSNLTSDFALTDLPNSMPVSILAETSLADPDTCKFIVSRPLHSGGPFFFGSQQSAAGSPLAARLFALPGVLNVLIAENVLTRTESRHSDGHPHAAADWRASDLGDAVPHQPANQHASPTRCRAEYDYSGTLGQAGE